MRWDYNVDFRDRFDRGPHRDILIVPHATRVTPVPGGPPEIESQVPEFIEDPEHAGQYIPKTDGQGNIEYKAVEFVITNDIIINEEFEYVQSICSNDEMTFGSTEAAMIKVRIRNNKSYDEEKSKWVLDIPDLAKYQIESDDGKILIGEVQASAVVEVYTYIDNDSSSLMWCGMYKVESDVVSDEGYEREITMYDFILTLRDMDIFEWYKAKFEGTPIDSDDPSQGKKPKGEKGSKYYYADEWELGDMLQDLISNLCEFAPQQPTVTNPKDYFCEMSASDYPGFGMPIMIDSDIFNPNAAMSIPEDAGENEYEHYGYMPIVNLKVRKDDKIIKKGSLSAGKFLEDIAMLAGRFCCIRADIRQENEYNEHPAEFGNYMLYDKCILTFRPILKDNTTIESENILDDSEIEKGLRYDYYNTKDIKLIDIYNYDAKRIIFYCPKGLKASTKKAYKQGKRNEIGNLRITENMFTSYLDPSKAEHKAIINMLETGTENVYGGKPLLKPCFDNVIERSYRPFTLTTTSDLCRQPGDRIKVSGIDKITGEPYEFESYILARSCKGIQKQMDTYTAKGNISSSNFSDYRSGETIGNFQPQSFGYGRLTGSGDVNTSGSENTGQSEVTIQGLTTRDLIEFLRNDGKRFLDEPTECEATWDSTHSQVNLKWKDPADISDEKPHPCTWEGTVVVRKEGSPPLHRWDGTKIVKSTTRDQYNQNGYIDDTVQKNKVYYYAFMPYFTTMDDEDLPYRRYTPTKVLMVNTQLIVTAPEIISINVENGTKANVEYKIPAAQSGTYEYSKLVYKKGSEPADASDGTAVTISNSEGTITINSLDENSTYYFEIFTKDTESNEASSGIYVISSGSEEYYTFGYTGEEQVFEAPVSGIYSIETWGAQGGDATDGTLVARGGYGAYAYGEMYLNAGDKLYINVGGQDGYNGGGILDPVPEDYQYIKNINDMDVYNANCTLHYSVFDDTHKYGWWRGSTGTFYEYTPIKPLNEMTTCANSGLTAHHNKNKTGTGNNIYTSFSASIITIKLNGNDSDGYDVTYENDNRTTLGTAFTGVYSSEQSYKGARLAINDEHSNPGAFTSLGGYNASGGSGYYGNFTSHYNSLSSALESIYDSFCNVNIYVNGILWVSV